MAQRADVDRYPPVLHQVAQLKDAFSITILDRATSPGGELEVSMNGVERVRLRPKPRGSKVLALARNVSEVRAFARSLDTQLDRGADVAFGYDADAAAVLLRSNHGKPRLRRVVHLHELPEAST